MLGRRGMTGNSRAFSDSKILLIGDLMLDRYVYGDVRRVSPEAPVPVLLEESVDFSIGAAGNCARNITALGDHVTLISVVGDDKDGEDLLNKIAEDEKITPYVMVEKGRKTTVKTRYLSENHQMLRVDSETSLPIAPPLQDRIIALAETEIPNHDVIVLSDYDKGVLTPKVLSGVIAASKGKPVIVDPKKTDWSAYSGATVVTPNLYEWFIASGLEYDPNSVMRKLEQCEIENVLVTRSKAGMTLVSRFRHDDIPAVARHIIDVTGAGDTAVAVLALGIASGYSLLDSANLANKAAGIVVGKPKTAVVTHEELFS